ncbi:MAG: hypothetical protein ACLS27_07495 [Eubacterium sp.]
MILKLKSLHRVGIHFSKAQWIFISNGQSPIRIKDLYMFGAGSCFGVKFDGCIKNVSTDQSRNIYRCAKPMWIGV